MLQQHSWELVLETMWFAKAEGFAISLFMTKFSDPWCRGQDSARCMGWWEMQQDAGKQKRPLCTNGPSRRQCLPHEAITAPEKFITGTHLPLYSNGSGHSLTKRTRALHHSHTLIRAFIGVLLSTKRKLRPSKVMQFIQDYWANKRWGELMPGLKIWVQDSTVFKDNWLETDRK